MDKNSLVENIPPLPGVYIMKNAAAEIIYIGKAISLKKRVQSYFSKSHDAKTSMLVNDIASIDYMITDNEIEALILECNLIKKHRPKYNIDLKDDKKYPYIKIASEKFPRIFISRNVRKDNAIYYGPFTNVKYLRDNMELIREMFPIRTCKTFRKNRACLNYHIKKCLAPCENKISEEEYLKNIDEIKLFLEGNQKDLISILKKKIEKLSDEMNFEEAAKIRDQINKINIVFEKQRVELGSDSDDEDVIAFAFENEIACAVIFFFREGKLSGERHFFINFTDKKIEDIVSEFIEQYYSSTMNFIPRNILINKKIAEEELIKQWLTKKRGGAVDIVYASRGEKLRRIEMVARNADNFLKVEIQKQKRKSDESGKLKKMQEILNLKKIPMRMEAFDISNISGKEAVGSMVVFKNGEPHKKEYRRFKIREVKGIDDYAMMGEVIKRRYGGSLKDKMEFPDLIIIDGGPGQLNSARKELEKLRLSGLDIISLAKQQEEIFMPNQAYPIKLPNDSSVLLLLKSIRDEAHRFAVNYHRLLRSEKFTGNLK